VSKLNCSWNYWRLTETTCVARLIRISSDLLFWFVGITRTRFCFGHVKCRPTVVTGARSRSHHQSTVSLMTRCCRSDHAAVRRRFESVTLSIGYTSNICFYNNVGTVFSRACRICLGTMNKDWMIDSFPETPKAYQRSWLPLASLS